MLHNTKLTAPKPMGKRPYPTRILTFFLFLTLSLFQVSSTALAASTRPSDVKKAGNGNILVGISGTYEQVSNQKSSNGLMKSEKKPARMAISTHPPRRNSPHPTMCL